MEKLFSWNSLDAFIENESTNKINTCCYCGKTTKNICLSCKYCFCDKHVIHSHRNVNILTSYEDAFIRSPFKYSLIHVRMK